jgi:hypothetical protein
VVFLASAGLVLVLVRRFTQTRAEPSGATPGSPGAADEEYTSRLNEELKDLD